MVVELEALRTAPSSVALCVFPRRYFAAAFFCRVESNLRTWSITAVLFPVDLVSADILLLQRCLSPEMAANGGMGMCHQRNMDLPEHKIQTMRTQVYRDSQVLTMATMRPFLIEITANTKPVQLGDLRTMPTRSSS